MPHVSVPQTIVLLKIKLLYCGVGEKNYLLINHFAGNENLGSLRLRISTQDQNRM